MRLSFKEDEGVWEYTNGQGDNVLRFGIGRVLSGKFPQRNYFGEQIGSVPGIEYDCLASAAWIDEGAFGRIRDEAARTVAVVRGGSP